MFEKEARFIVVQKDLDEIIRKNEAYLIN